MHAIVAFISGWDPNAGCGELLFAMPFAGNTRILIKNLDVDGHRIHEYHRKQSDSSGLWSNFLISGRGTCAAMKYFSGTPDNLHSYFSKP